MAFSLSSGFSLHLKTNEEKVDRTVQYSAIHCRAKTGGPEPGHHCVFFVNGTYFSLQIWLYLFAKCGDEISFSYVISTFTDQFEIALYPSISGFIEFRKQLLSTVQ